MLSAQITSDLKSTYDSIVGLTSENKSELITTFFIQHQNHPDQLQLALCYHEYSKKIYRIDVNSAINYSKKAIKIRKKNKDTSEISKSFYALGYYYKLKGNYPKAIQAYTKLIEYRQKNDITAKAFNRIGIMYTLVGDFDKAKNNLVKAEEYFKNSKKYKLLFRNYVNLSQMYERMNWLYDKRSMYYVKCADSLSNIISLNNLDYLNINQISGNLYDERQEYAKAIAYHKKALAVSHQMKDSSYISMNYSNIGVSCKKSNDLVNAKIYYDKALSYAGSNTNLQAPVYNNLGDYYTVQLDFRNALTHYHKAITSVLGALERSDYTVLPDIEKLKVSPYKLDLLGYITDYANGWISYYNHEQQSEYLKKALEAFELADQLVDVIRFESTEFQSKLFWREQSADLYMKAVEACYKLSKSKEAFYFMEKNKAILLLEDLTQEKAKENAQLPEALSEREFDLRRSIHLAEEELKDDESTTALKKDSLRDIIYEHKRRYEKFIDSLETGYPGYYKYKQKLQLVSYDQVKKQQNERNQATMYYILNDKEGYGLFLSKNKEKFFKINDVNALHKNLITLRHKLATPFYTEEEFISFQKLANTIYNTLFPEISPNVFIDGNVVLIPDQHLQQIPFEVLMTSSTDSTSYLINQCNISYAYSLSFLQLNEKVARLPQNDFIGFAPVKFKDSTLVGLLRSTEEVNEIASLFDGKVYDYANASKDKFMSAISNYNMVHLSTHADVGESTDPWIAFYDDKLSLDELYATKNQADLVVLSACNTSLGELKTGEGVMSLARGFFSSGTRSVISTLWSVNEKSTHEIMSNFYTYIKEGNTKTEALQKAKRTYLKNNSGVATSPHYWGAPILIGNIDGIDVRSDLPWYWYLIGGVVILAVIVFLLKKYKNAKGKRL